MTYDHPPIPHDDHCCPPPVPRKKRDRTPVGRLPDKHIYSGSPHKPHRCVPCSGGPRLPVADLYLNVLNITPLPGTDGALNKAALTVSPLGVFVILPAWFGQVAGDHVTYELNGTVVTFYTITDDDALIGKDVILPIPAFHFNDQANNTLQAFVESVSGITEQTDLLSIWVDQKSPGWFDPQPSTPYNENLGRIVFDKAEHEAFGIISDADAQNGVKVKILKYPLNPLVDPDYHRKEGDVIIVSIGGILVQHTVTYQQASGDLPITMTISYGTWSQVPPGAHIIEWSVRDKAGNQSIGYSVPRLIQFNKDGGANPLLLAPLVQESLYDPETDEDYIDADAQSGDLETEVSVRNYGWMTGDELVVNYKGLTADGQPREHSTSLDIANPNVLRVYVPLPLAFLKGLAKGRLLVTYKRVRPGVADVPSHAALYSVRGESMGIGYPPPFVEDLVNDALPEGTDPVRITVPEGLEPGAKVDLYVEGTGLDGTVVRGVFTEMAVGAPIEYFLDWLSLFEPLLGSVFSAYYVVNDDIQRPSESTIVRVGNIVISRPPPTSPEAPPPDNRFNELVSKGNLKVLVHPHPSIALNDEVRVVVTSSVAASNITTAWLKVSSVWFNKDLPFTIPRNLVLLSLGKVLTIHWEVRTLPTEVPQKSKPLYVKVGATLELTDYVNVLEATSLLPGLSRLNPLHVWDPSPRIITFRVEYKMQPADCVTIIVDGNRLSPSVPGIPDTGEKHKSIEFPSDLIAPYIGSSFEVLYEVLRDGIAYTSPALRVDVEELPLQVRDLVSVPQASGGVIDTSASNAVEIRAWPFFSRTQPVSIYLMGPHDETLRDGVKVSAAEFAAKRTQDLIPKSYWSGINDGDHVTVEAKVSMDGSGDPMTAMAFKKVSYVVQRKAVIIKTILVGNSPKKILITPNGKKLFILCIGSREIFAIDTGLQIVDKVIALSWIYNIGLSTDGTRLFTCRASGTATNYVYSTATYALLGYVNNATYTLDVALSGDDSKIYYSEYPGQNLLVFNPSSGTLQKSIALNYGGNAFFIKPSPDGSIALIGTNLSWLYRFNLLSDTFLGNSPSLGATATDVAYGPNGSRAFYTTANRVGVLDYLSNTVIGTLPGFTNAVAIAHHPSLDRAYVSDRGTNSVMVLDTSGNDPVLVDTLTGFTLPGPLVVSPDGNLLYVCNQGADSVSIVQL